MSHHISSVCRSAYLEMRRISTIRPFLTTSATATLVCSWVLSWIDYCNSVLAGITSNQIARLQRILDNSARLIFRKKRSEHVTPMLISLHWLPIKQHTLAFCYFDGTLPLTSHTVSPCTPPTDHFDHLLTNCSVSHMLTWKAPVQGLSNIRRLVCGTLSRYKPDCLHLSHLLNPASNSKRTSSTMPSHESLKLGGGGGGGATKHGTNRRACCCRHCFICFVCVWCVFVCGCVCVCMWVLCGVCQCGCVHVYMSECVHMCSCACEGVSECAGVCV